MFSVTRLMLGLAIFTLAAPLTSAAADAPFKLRVSLDTSATHIRTMSVPEYLKKLEEASGGRIQTELFHSGQLFRDRDIAKALRQGNIEMAVPGTWVLSGFIPDTDFVMLPIMAGQPAEIVHKVADGKVGQMVDEELEKKLDVKVVGPWFDLGFNNGYSTKKPLDDFSDYAGMKLRNSGGAGQALRAKFFGAIPNTTAWPDVPLALSQGTFDALTSTNESLASAKLWDSGVKYAFEDHSYFAMYIPLVADRFYNTLPADLQKLMVEVWDKNIPLWREKAAESQAKARKELEEHGIKFVDPSPDRLAEVRQKLMSTEDEVAKELKISPALLQELRSELQGAS